jgi:O-acetyl-ADP-ribose deacetylase (regulator of RNase III)
MIKEVKGDILLSACKTIVQSVAPNDHMDAGLALSLRELHPSMTKDFRHFCHLKNPKPGDIWTWKGVGGHCIINLMAQEPTESKSSGGHPGKASISNLDKCLKNLAKSVSEEGIDEIVMPKLATGVGGLEWQDVLKLINKHFEDSHTRVLVYTTYVKGQKGEEN